MKDSRGLYQRNKLYINVILCMAILVGIAYRLYQRIAENDNKKNYILNFAQNACSCDSAAVHFLSCRDSSGKKGINCEVTFFNFDTIYKNSAYLTETVDGLAPSIFYNAMNFDTSTYCYLTLIFRGPAYKDCRVFRFPTKGLYHDWRYEKSQYWP